MTLVRFDEVRLEFGDQVLLRDAEFALEEGERVCLIGRNGAGKSTTMKLITGVLQPDSGEVHLRNDLVVSQLEQALPGGLDRTVREVVMSGLSGVRELLDAYAEKSGQQLDAAGMRELEDLQHRIDSRDGWNIDQRVESTMSELGLPAEKQLSELSGGWRRRVGLARALVCKPDLLLLDEPTNHLDLATIQWLEDRIYAHPGSVLFITHDRAFLQRLATRIVELDRGSLVSWPGDYRNYLRRRDKAIEDEAAENARFDKKLAEEEEWIRQGIKARRTRNEGRVRALESMREERAQRIKRENSARIHIDEAEQSGRKVIEMRGVSYGYGDTALIRNLSMKVMRGDRIGLVGNNGVGKSTLLRIMLGEIEPHAGSVKLGTNLEIGYFDQLRQALDPDKTIAENVGNGREYIKINGRDRHIVGYLKGFLFSPKRAMTPVSALSGGERNRVILAKLLTRPANLLVLDEPTNDLDVETLEVLEARLAEYRGTLLVVSHDREFLDHVVTSILVFEDDGRVHEYVGSYSDWVRRGHRLADLDQAAGSEQVGAAQTAAPPAAAENKRRRLSYKEKYELENLPQKIEELEAEIAALNREMAEPDFYSRDHARMQQTLDRLSAASGELEAATERWLELEELGGG